MLFYLCKDVKKDIMKIFRCLSNTFKRCKYLAISDHTHHITLILKTTHSDISLKMFSFSETKHVCNSISFYSPYCFKYIL